MTAQRYALDQVVTRHYAQLVRFLSRRMRNDDEAADIAQDAFARLSAQTPGQVREPGAFLFSVALNLLRDRARAASVRPGIADLVDATETDIACPVPLADRTLAGRQELELLRAALGELPDKCRTVLVLSRFDGLSQSQIADRLGISVSSVEKYLKRALDHCRLRLQQADADKKMPSRKGVTR